MRYFYNEKANRMIELNDATGSVTVFEPVGAVVGDGIPLFSAAHVPPTGSPEMSAIVKFDRNDEVLTGKKVKRKNGKRQFTCKKCGGLGHIAKTCQAGDAESAPEKPADQEAPAPSKYEDDEDLTAAEKYEILEKFREGAGGVTTQELAREYGVNIKVIWGVIKNRPQ